MPNLAAASNSWLRVRLFTHKRGKESEENEVEVVKHLWGLLCYLTTLSWGHLRWQFGRYGGDVAAVKLGLLRYLDTLPAQIRSIAYSQFSGFSTINPSSIFRHLAITIIPSYISCARCIL